ncbi:hypothetical protein FHK02_5945 [Spirosoma sp. LMG 31448]|nr:hypothetical protein [Spirosoma utsteinense]
MRFIYRLLTTFLTCLPMLLIAVSWEFLPVRLPLHFTRYGLPDRFGNRYEWYGQLLGTLLLLVIVRALILRTVSNKLDKGQAQGPALYLITAGFVASFNALLILQGLYIRPLFAQWQPLLVALLASSFVYFAVPLSEPISGSKIRLSTLSQPQPISQWLHPLSRLIGIRVNLLAALLMVAVKPQDRWSIALMANVLAFLAIVILGLVKQRRSI